MKPSIPQGTRDFGPETVRKRNYIFNTIRAVFELYGFQPLETPAMENLETLMGKYGEEGDRLIFRILDSGNPFGEDFIIAFQQFLKDHDTAYNTIISEQDINKTSPYAKPFWEILVKDLVPIFKKLIDKEYARFLPKFHNAFSSKALRYDLTIPFARYVAMNHGQLTFPYKRYQMQPVWRADRPQKGRYREFYQCDADVIGSNSILNEVELANIYTTVFEKLGVDIKIRINNRKILLGVAEAIGAPDKMIDMAIAIDKFEKIGLDGVKNELNERGFTSNQIKDLTDFIFAAANRIAFIDVKLEEGEDPTLHFLKYAAQKYSSNENYKKGIDELEELMKKNKNSKFKIDLSLARGINYYTGVIFEVQATNKNVSIGSIGGGGRYDDLTGLFGVPNIPGVGISFGVDRIYDVMEELGKLYKKELFPEDIYIGTKVLFFNLGEEESKTAFSLMQQLRNKNIACELFHENAKFDKQFKYADKKNIPYIVIIGSKELSEKTCTIKNLKSGEQQTIQQEEIISFFLK